MKRFDWLQFRWSRTPDRLFWILALEHLKPQMGSRWQRWWIDESWILTHNLVLAARHFFRRSSRQKHAQNGRHGKNGSSLTLTSWLLHITIFSCKVLVEVSYALLLFEPNMTHVACSLWSALEYRKYIELVIFEWALWLLKLYWTTSIRTFVYKKVRPTCELCH